MISKPYKSQLKPKLVIDASFWINITYIGIEKYLVKYFSLYVVPVVENEILSENDHKLYNTRDMEIYLKLKDLSVIIIKNAKFISKKLLDNLQVNSGELYSVALAIEENMIVATDDNGVIQFNIKNKVANITSIKFILYLYCKKDVSEKQAIDYINQLVNRIKFKYIEDGINYLKNKR